MARPKEFDPEEALAAAVGVFRNHGYAGTSAEMLSNSMQIGRQSLYDTFGGKWPLYCAALEHYVAAETKSHIAALKAGLTAFGGVERMMERVASEARMPCLGVNSVCEFGEDNEDLVKIRKNAGQALRAFLTSRIREAQADGDMSADLDPDHAAGFLIASVAGIRIAARGGAGDTELRAFARLSLQAIR